jgi:hypothetical protein
MLIENEDGKVGLMFGKKNNSVYVLNVCWPFCLLEGFFLAVCNLDHKLFAL